MATTTYADLDRRWRQAVADRDEHDRQVAAWLKRTPRYGHPNEETVARSNGGKRAALTRRIIAIENAIDELRGR